MNTPTLTSTLFADVGIGQAQPNRAKPADNSPTNTKAKDEPFNDFLTAEKTTDNITTGHYHHPHKTGSSYGSHYPFKLFEESPN